MIITLKFSILIANLNERKIPRQKGDWPQTLTQEEITLNKESKIFLVKSFQGTVRRTT